jgi:polysaccharide deacetylase family protein (PEP-CTERM system associated)
MTSAPITNAMSVDVEDYFHVAALSSAIDRSAWGQMEYRAEANVERLLELFAAKGIHATFFMLGWVAQRSPHIAKKIHAAGHEVASHGMSHRLIYTQEVEEFRDETRAAKALLEDQIGCAVLGYRAATYSITEKSLWALDVLAEAGFQYDSSIFPIRHDLYGIPNAPLRPTRIATPAGASIVEFPMSTVDMFGVRLPVSGGGYFRLLPYWLTRAGLRKLNQEQKRPFVFYLHPWEIDPEQPRIQVGWRSRFRHYTNLEHTEVRLIALIDEFRFSSLYEVLSNAGLFAPHSSAVAA